MHHYHRDLRREPVLQLSESGAHAGRAERPVGQTQAAAQALRLGLGHAAARTAMSRTRLLRRQARAGHRRARVHRLEPGHSPARARRARRRRRQPDPRDGRQPVQHRAGPGPPAPVGAHGRRARRAGHAAPGAQPGGDLQPGRPGQPHRLDAGSRSPTWRSTAAASWPCSRPAAAMRPKRRSSSPARARSTAACPRTTCPSTSGSRRTRSTSTASTSWPASATTCSTTTCTAFAPACCG